MSFVVSIVFSFPYFSLHIILSIVTTLLLALIAFIAYVFYQKKKQDAKSRELSIRRDEFEQEMADKIRKQLEELERREKKSKMNGVGKKQEKSGPISQYFPETISDPGSLPKNGTPTASPLKSVLFFVSELLTITISELKMDCEAFAVSILVSWELARLRLQHHRSLKSKTHFSGLK